MNYWMLGADWGGNDQTQKFIEQGIWQNGYTDKFLDTVKKVQVGDKVAIKTVYVQKNNLPFNNYGCDVSCMKIKVIGEVTENIGDGRTLKVTWEPLAQERMVYLYTYWHTIMRIARPFVKEWIFNEVAQDYAELEEIYKKKSGRVNDQLSDEQILDHFKTVDGYLDIIQNEAQTSLFLDLVRFMHKIPLDWWIIHNDSKHQIRFGENKSYNGAHSTNRILGFLDFKPEGLFLTSNQEEFFSTQERIHLTREIFDELKKADFSAIDKQREPYIGYLPNDYVDNMMIDKITENTEQNFQPLNRILFGAAGTGKTFHSINHALSILENKPLEVLEQEDRSALKLRFDEYKAQGQIKFVTFHQSFSYEDFVEGIRAESVEDSEGSKNIEYPIIPGVFKSICDAATIKTVVENRDTEFNPSKNQIWKMSLGRAGTDEEIYQYCIQNNCVLLGWGEDLDFSNAQTKKQIEILMDENGYSEYRKKYPSASRFVNDFKNKIKLGDLIIVSDGNHKFRAIAEVIGDYSLLPAREDVPDYLQKRAVKWLNIFRPSLAVEHLFNKVLSQQTIYNLANAINLQKLTNILTTTKEVDDQHKKFVLIVDEINRGNISRIFGELITLIEDSKRQGAEEELSVTLPYSKEEFSVPSNVYIIGTMNSSDRSLTGLDIALRRRFTFIEMPPKPELLNEVKVEGLSVGELLKVINQRIEVLLDRDHCIGHANFMSLKKQPTLEHLADIFKQKIIPQLQEYFFDDWAKINMVLNANGMLKAKPIERSVLFPNVETDSDGFFEEQKTWQLNDTAFDSIASFSKIIKH